MKSKILGLLAAVLIGSSGTAMAVPILVGTTTDPTGIDGLVVGGVTYDVTFSITTLDSPFVQGTQLSVDAASAIAAVLTSFEVTALDGVTPQQGSPLLILVNGAFGTNDEAFCGFSTCSAGSWSTGFGPATTLGPIVDPFTGATLGYTMAANFIAVPDTVPEPRTLALLGLGLLGFGVTRRRAN